MATAVSPIRKYHIFFGVACFEVISPFLFHSLSHNCEWDTFAFYYTDASYPSHAISTSILSLIFMVPLEPFFLLLESLCTASYSDVPMCESRASYEAVIKYALEVVVDISKQVSQHMYLLYFIHWNCKCKNNVREL